MALIFKTFKQILEDFAGYVIPRSKITDLNVGSIVRTIGEATSLELAQGYVQLQSLLNLFSVDKSLGTDLEDRAQDFGLQKNPPTKSSGYVTIGDEDLTTRVYSTTASALTGGVSTTVQVQTADYASFPSSGFVVLDRGDATRRELVEYTSKTGPDILNLSGTVTNNHDSGITVYLSTVGVDRVIPARTLVKVPATALQDEVQFETTAEAVLLDGDIEVTSVTIQSVETGSATNVGASKITDFVSPPFPTATVTNDDATFGGEDIESDDAFKARIKTTLSSRMSAAPSIVVSSALKVSIPETGQRVVTASLIEPVTSGTGVLYINDGSTTYVPTEQSVEPESEYVSTDGAEIVVSSAKTGQRRGSLENWPIVTNTERLFVSLERGTATSTGVNTLTDTTKTWTTNEWAGFWLKDGDDQLYPVVSNTGTALTLSGGHTPALANYALVNPDTDVYPTGSRLVKDTDYVINDTNGQFELTADSFPTGLESKDCILAVHTGTNVAYRYYDGLLQEVQKVLNGDPADWVTYPGVIAEGCQVRVTAPDVQTITVDVSITVKSGISEETVRETVRSAIVNYINGLGIGEDVLVSGIIAVSKAVTGVYDVLVVNPSANVIITQSQLAKTTLSDVTVS